MNYSKFIENSRKWLTDYIEENHLQSLVIGISGGIDSTVSCAIAYPVCQELSIPLIGRSLPSNTNKSQETNAANLVGKAFCDSYRIIPINKSFYTILTDLMLCEGEVSKLQEGNIKARLRMIYLRHIAADNKGVVLDNDNFSEWNLGFWTVGGDSPMDINLGLHYLWKHQIYELVDYLADEIYEKVEGTNIYSKQYQAIIESARLTPTDGNGVSNSDCEQFGLDNYEQVDDILKYLTGEEDDKDDIEYNRLVNSYGEDGVDRVIMLHHKTHYKRIPSPIMPTREELEL